MTAFPLQGWVTEKSKSTLLEVIAQMLTYDPDQPDTLQGIDIDPTGPNIVITSQVWDHEDGCSRVFVTAIREDGSTDNYEEH
jgi:hypothetical protein